MSMSQTRRRFLTMLSAVGGAGLIRSSRASAAEQPPETTTVRFGKDPSICVAPMDVAEELLRTAGFTDIRYVEVEAFTAVPGLDPITRLGRHSNPKADRWGGANAISR